MATKRSNERVQLTAHLVNGTEEYDIFDVVWTKL